MRITPVGAVVEGRGGAWKIVVHQQLFLLFSDLACVYCVQWINAVRY